MDSGVINTTCKMCHGQGGWFFNGNFGSTVAVEWEQCEYCSPWTSVDLELMWSGVDLDLKTIALRAIIDADSLEEAHEIARLALFPFVEVPPTITP